MLRKQMWYLFFKLYILLTAPLLLVVAALNRLNRTSERDRLVQWFLSTTSRKMIWMTGSQVTVSGLENLPPKGPVVFISSHQSHFDSAVIFGYIPLPKGFIAAIEASRHLFWGTWFAYAPTVFMERDNIRQSLEAINRGVSLVQEGYSMVVYPEGVVSNTSQMAEFKRGAFRLATASKATIVPLAIRDTHRIMGEDIKKISPAQIGLAILEPIPTADLSKEELGQLASRVQSQISEALASTSQS